MKKLFFSALIIGALFFGAGAAEAHQPRLVYKMYSTPAVPFIITNPQVSQAFYGELKGQPDYYVVTMTEPTDFYFGLLSPDIAGAAKDYKAALESADKRLMAVLDPATSPWKPFYEEFAGDNYFRGPEKITRLSAGDYHITVENPKNLGKYVLVVGQLESFPPGETFKTIINLPVLKKDFFGKSPLTAFSNKIGGYLGAGLLALVILIAVVIVLIKKVYRHRRHKRK